MTQQLVPKAQSYTAWLRDAAIPLWSTTGIDAHGASVERLFNSGLPDLCANKRIRVQARQMFAFCYAQHRGWISNGSELVSDLDAFVEHFAKCENSNIYAHILNAKNEVINHQHDLYDCAFFLLAYGWRYHVFGDLKALRRAEKLLGQIDTELKHLPGGWSEGNYSAPFRRQNPHMHLFEAFLTLYQVTKQGKWLAKAGEIFCLFETRFFDRQRGVLMEYFDHEWHPQTRNGVMVVEPGHMMEWVWLLRQYEKHTHAPVEDICHILYHNALKIGRDNKTNLLYDEVDPKGKIVKGTKRCWPMTEWIKASLVQADSAKDKLEYDYQADASTALNSLMSHYKRGAQYIDQIGEHNEIISDHAPASTLYHLLMAEAETNRFITGHADVY